MHVSHFSISEKVRAPCLSPAAGGIYTLCTALGEFFYHTNVRTPQWIGYIFQRPEMHRIHHEYQKHAHNYGDIVWWDMLFGTYRNPGDWSASSEHVVDRTAAMASSARGLVATNHCSDSRGSTSVRQR